ncbi:2OG-Fe(II) oxygenase family protein [Streptomyces sp. NPDC096079]|uniref:2OG-Fe(II) oxygenase family protein n=1 Tax=unclassified Streptomyces TaxID=2593676 RepID=UPI00331A6230
MSSTTTRSSSPVPPALAGAAPYVAPRYLTESTVERLRDWYHGDPVHPLQLRDFLRPEFATDLAAAMRAIPTWSRHAATYEGRLGKTEFWDDEVDEQDDVTIAQFVVKDIHALLDEGAMDPGHQRTLQEFFVFSVLTDALRDWIGSGTGLVLRKHTTMELAAYRRSDALGAHQDLVPGRVLAVNFYLDEEYTPESGGRLAFRNGQDQEFFVEPVFNSVSLMPIREDCWHWVEPFTRDAVGRYTIAMGQHLEGS